MARPYPTISCSSHIEDNGKGYRVWTINGRTIREHRLVMELALGRRLLPSEIVHHKDDNKLNNDLDNLEITDRAHHRYLHGSFQDDTSKECSKCHLIKPLTEFWKRQNPKDRRAYLSWCISCDRAKYRKDSEGGKRREKLTLAQVAKIRELYATGSFTYVQIGRQLNIHCATIGYICRGKTWRPDSKGMYLRK